MTPAGWNMIALSVAVVIAMVGFTAAIALFEFLMNRIDSWERRRR